MEQEKQKNVIRISSKEIHNKILEEYKISENIKFIKDISSYFGVFLGILFGGHYGCIYNSYLITFLLVYGFTKIIENLHNIFVDYVFYFPMNLKTITDKDMLNLLNSVIDTKTTHTDLYFSINEEKYDNYLSSRDESYDNNNYDSNFSIYCNINSKGNIYPIKYNNKEDIFESDIAVAWKPFLIDKKLFLTKEVEIYSIFCILIVLTSFFVKLRLLSIISLCIIIFIYFSRYKFNINSLYNRCTLIPEYKRKYYEICKHTLNLIISEKNKNLSKYYFLNNVNIKNNIVNKYLDLKLNFNQYGSEAELNLLEEKDKSCINIILETVVNNIYHIDSNF